MKKLSSQAIALDINYEILCYDDGSAEPIKEKNASLNALKNIAYLELPQNIGRAKIRNKLGQEAKYEWLLFIDCDMEITESDYLSIYIQSIDNHSIIYGGISYKNEIPKDKNYSLRWHYGVKNESTLAHLRNKMPYLHFKTCNFLIQKNIFLQFQFSESFVEYGHEDTHLGFTLYKAKIPVAHINNPLQHNGLDTNVDFVNKSKMAIENLKIMLANPELVAYMSQTKLVKLYLLIKKLKCRWLVYKYLNLRKNSMLQNLISHEPSLLNFNLLKLYWLIKK